MFAEFIKKGEEDVLYYEDKIFSESLLNKFKYAPVYKPQLVNYNSEYKIFYKLREDIRFKKYTEAKDEIEFILLYEKANNLEKVVVSSTLKNYFLLVSPYEINKLVEILLRHPSD